MCEYQEERTWNLTKLFNYNVLSVVLESIRDHDRNYDIDYFLCKT